jgi:malonate decarboxylase epsilon subunit
MDTALLFPGQGAQRPGMLHNLVNHPATEETLQEISAVLRFDVRRLDTAESLKSTVSVQLALLAAGVATARALQQSGLEPTVVLGLSVGAFAAAVAAEALSLKDAVTLVRSRAEQMEKLYPVGYGMAAIVGLNEMQVSTLAEATRTTGHPVFIANINAPRQIVIAGSIQGMEIVLNQAISQGARKAELLDVSVPSHCPLLQPVSDCLRAQLSSMSLCNPTVTYIANVNARAIRTAQGIVNDLADNIDHSVRWHDATTVAKELGCKLFLEMPPGHTLTDLALRNVPNIEAYSVTDEIFHRVPKLTNS